MEILTKYALEIFFGLVSAGALAFCKHLYSKNKKLEEMQKADQNRQYRQMILDEIEPIINEITRLKSEITKVDTDAKVALTQFKTEADITKQHMYDDLNEIQAKNDENFKLIINSYKFRLIQLCKTHLRDGYITESDFEQITEMYKLYHGLGGNGQAQEYYDKVLELDIRKDNDIQ
jgi:hypothetical protein